MKTKEEKTYKEVQILKENVGMSLAFSEQNQKSGLSFTINIGASASNSNDAIKSFDYVFKKFKELKGGYIKNGTN